MLREITVATRLVVVCNPNNPTSTALPVAGHRELRRRGARPRVGDRRRGLLRVQHARRPRSVRASCSRAHPNLALLRTFSKVYGLCGLRVGFALCGSEELVRALDQVRQPFFCNALAQAAAVEALAHQDAVEDRVTRTIAERISVDERLRALGLAPAESQANFCWFSLPRGRARGGRDARPGRARRARARGQRAGQGGGAARHLRHHRGERTLPRRRSRTCSRRSRCSALSRRAALDLGGRSLLQRIAEEHERSDAYSRTLRTRARVSARVAASSYRYFSSCAWRFS